MFDCAKRRSRKVLHYYSDAAATRVIERSAPAIPGFGSPIGGSMTQVALDYLCKK